MKNYFEKKIMISEFWKHIFKNISEQENISKS